jgi:RNA-binding protein YhbY
VQKKGLQNKLLEQIINKVKDKQLVKMHPVDKYQRLIPKKKEGV